MAIFSLTDSVVTNQDIVSHSLELGQVACSESLEYQIFLFVQVLRIVATEDQQSIFSYLHPIHDELPGLAMVGSIHIISLAYLIP